MLRGKAKHPLNTDKCFAADVSINVNLVPARLQHVGQILQPVHCHPRPVRATIAGRAIARRRYLNEAFDARFESRSCSRRQHCRHTRPSIGAATGAQAHPQALEFNGLMDRACIDSRH